MEGFTLGDVFVAVFATKLADFGTKVANCRVAVWI